MPPFTNTAAPPPHLRGFIHHQRIKHQHAPHPTRPRTRTRPSSRLLPPCPQPHPPQPAAAATPAAPTPHRRSCRFSSFLQAACGAERAHDDLGAAQHRHSQLLALPLRYTCGGCAAGAVWRRARRKNRCCQVPLYLRERELQALLLLEKLLDGKLARSWVTWKLAGS